MHNIGAMNDDRLRKAISLFLLFIPIINCYNQSYLEHFNTHSLSRSFQTFNLSSCPEEVSQCWKEVHELAELCIRHHRSKSGSKIAQCSAREDLQMSEKEYEELSSRWHHSMDKCFYEQDFDFSNDTSEEEVEEPESRTSNENRTSKLFRAKRARHLMEDNAAENVDDDEEEEQDVHANNLKKAKRCWAILNRRKTSCFDLSFQCPQFSSCFGVGKRPEEGNARKWYKLVEQQRKAARQKTQEHKQKMLRCIETV